MWVFCMFVSNCCFICLYRYYACDWVKEVFYHPVGPSNKVAYVKADVHPSMNIRKKAWKVWIIVGKKTNNDPGGAIKAAHCTCPAGLMGCCNHIAGVLFRIECAVRTGATEKTCTEKACQWVTPGRGVPRKPRKWRDVMVMKHKYGGKTSTDERRKRIEGRRSFQPFHAEDEEKLQDGDQIRSRLTTVMAKVAPQSVFVLTETKQKPSKPPAPNLPPTPTMVAEKASSVDELIDGLAVSQAEVEELNDATKKQDSCPSSSWRQQRCGRITSTSFYSVHTKMETIKKKVDNGEALHELKETAQDSWLTKKVTGQGKDILTEAMKHGIALEEPAKRAYEKQMKKDHVNVNVKASGLVVCTKNPFLAASPDLVVSCDCHGDRLVEIKCPASVKSAAPSVDNVPYLMLDTEGSVVLKDHHTYYGQIQGQLAITGHQQCDLFVYTEHGNVTVPVYFNSKFWKEMLDNIIWFYRNVVAPEFLKLHSVVPLKRVSDEDIGGHVVSKKVCTLPASSEYVCGKCTEIVEEVPETFEDESVGCDKCPQWYHLKCVNLVSAPNQADDWVCPDCA